MQAVFSASLHQSSVSRDPSEIILILMALENKATTVSLQTLQWTCGQLYFQPAWVCMLIDRCLTDKLNVLCDVNNNNAWPHRASIQQQKNKLILLFFAEYHVSAKKVQTKSYYLKIDIKVALHCIITLLAMKLCIYLLLFETLKVSLNHVNIQTLFKRIIINITYNFSLRCAVYI